MNRAQEAFEEFHARSSSVVVYPFVGEQSSSEFEIDCLLPDFVHVGKAIRVEYDSDKWNEVGDVVGYYHDHGPNDGGYSFTSQNKVKLYAPAPYFPDLPVAKFPVRWPSGLTHLGACSNWYAQEPDFEDVTQGNLDDCVLFCSPYGHVSNKDKRRVFLVAVEYSTGVVECIITGPNLRLTPEGITG